MNTKCVVIGEPGHSIKLSDPEIWKDLERRLNSPTQEIRSTRAKFFAECEKLFITKNTDNIIVETEKLDT